MLEVLEVTSPQKSSSSPLRRVIGLPGAVMLGLGSILGTGVFVSIGLSAGIARSWTLPAILLAALLALANGLSSAQLAANHPTSGGTYEYGYRFLHPVLGFIAGWLFVCAKSASAATAALGASGYLLSLLGMTDGAWVTLAALALVMLVAALALTGMRRSTMANTVIVSVTVVSLLAFIIAGFPNALASSGVYLRGLVVWGHDSSGGFRPLFEASALMFVAYAGYGRVATLGEEVLEPRKTIPRAILITLAVTVSLYLAVAFVAIGSVGSDVLAELTFSTGAPLQEIASSFKLPIVPTLLAAGAVSAMLGVLLNLSLGLSRVILAMARRGDLPSHFSKVSGKHDTPKPAVLATAVLILALTCSGNMAATWSLSAFCVLVYYAITNLTAYLLPASQRLYPKWISGCGLLGCLFLAAWVHPNIWRIGIALIGTGLIWFSAARLLTRAK